MKKADLVIRGGLILDPAKDKGQAGDVLIRKGVLEQAGGKVPVKEEKGKATLSDGTPVTVIEASSWWVTPGLIDLHAHFREPGREDQETILTGSSAAAAGGFVAAAVMANTAPCNDYRPVTESIVRKGREVEPFMVLPVGAVTVGREGKTLSEMADLAEAGCAAFSDDGRWITDAGVFRRALEYGRGIGRPILVHPEDPDLSRGGVMHEGKMSTRLGLPGIPGAAEAAAVARDLEVTADFPHQVHFQHCSTTASIRLLERAKNRGLPVSAEVTPHHLLLTDREVESFDPRFKMNPPLRTDDDRRALIEAVNQGIIDAIATDHAPWTVAEKEGTFLEAPFGVIGLETAAAVVVELVAKHRLDLMSAVRALTISPARILGLDLGRFTVGKPASVTLINPAKRWVAGGREMVSKSSNTPFEGREMTGRVMATIAGGELIYQWEGEKEFPRAD